MDRPGLPQFEQAEFNQAIAYLYRLHNIMIEIDRDVMTRNFQQLYWDTWALHLELEPMFPNTKLAEQYSFSEHEMEATKSFDIYMASRNKTFSLSLIRPLFKWQGILRKFINDKGMLMPKAKDARYALKSGR